MNANRSKTGLLGRSRTSSISVSTLALSLFLSVPLVGAQADNADAQMTTTSGCSPSPPEQCETGNSIVGIWQSPGIRISIIKAGCLIAASFWGGTTAYHELVGYKTGDGYDLQVTRTADNCTVVFKGRFLDIGPSTMKGEVGSTSGDCGFATTWTEKRNYIRVK